MEKYEKVLELVTLFSLFVPLLNSFGINLIFNTPLLYKQGPKKDIEWLSLVANIDGQVICVSL